MIVTSWNCNLKLKSKYEYIESLESDILIIQECEKLAHDYFPNFQFFWIGQNENKGLGVLVKDKSSKISECHNSNYVYFLPIETDQMNILAVWAYNHRAIKYGAQFDGSTLNAIEYYKDWLSSKDIGIVAGDFNNSIIWDKKNNEYFTDTNKKLNSLQFNSSYHEYTQDKFGEESDATFYHTKNRNKTYHIDYIFTKNTNIQSCIVGNYDNWIKYSDHCPISIKI